MQDFNSQDNYIIYEKSACSEDVDLKRLKIMKMAGISQYRIVPQRTSVQEPLNKQGSHNEILTTAESKFLHRKFIFAIFIAGKEK